jgi:hypothetical protein
MPVMKLSAGPTHPLADPGRVSGDTIRRGRVKTMRIDTYQNRANGNQYLSVPSGTDLAEIGLPDGSDFRAWRAVNLNEEIVAGESRAAMDAADVIKQIEARGFALHGVAYWVEIREVPPPKKS